VASNDQARMPSDNPTTSTLPGVRWGGRWQRVLRAWVALLFVMMGCSAGDLLIQPTPTAILTAALVPTFTPTPVITQEVIIVTPPVDGTPGVIIIPPGMDPGRVLPSPTLTPTPGPGSPVDQSVNGTPLATATLLPTETPAPTFTPTPTPTPTPFIVVESGLVSLRTGPGVEYPLVGQLGPGVPIALVGRTSEGTWHQVCCVNGQTVWVASTHVRVVNDPIRVALVGANQSPPAPTPTFPPTATGTATPTPTATRYPFERARGPEFYPTNNQFLTIWVKLYAAPPGGGEAEEIPLAGYFLRVNFQMSTLPDAGPGDSRPSTGVERPSATEFSYSAAEGAGNRVKFNYKYEYTPPLPTPSAPNVTPPADAQAQALGTGTWTVVVVDGAGNQLADAVTFLTAPANLNREVYIAWIKTR